MRLIFNPLQILGCGCILLLLPLSSLPGQIPDKIPFEEYGISDGIPEEAIMYLLQDEQGFIWFATQNGLVKYDGYDFKVFKGPSGEKEKDAAPFGIIFGLLRGRDGKIWIGSEQKGGGLSVYDPQKERFQRFDLSPEDPLSEQTLTTLLLEEDAQGNIWFKHRAVNQEENVICRFDPRRQKIDTYPWDNPGAKPLASEFRRTHFFATIQKDSSVWLLDKAANLLRWHPQQKRFDPVIKGGEILPGSPLKDSVKLMYPYGKDLLFLAGKKALYIWDPIKKKVTREFSWLNPKYPSIFSTQAIKHVFADPQGNFWLIHAKGQLSQILPQEDSLIHYIPGEGKLAFPDLPARPLIAELMTKEGIWFRTSSFDGPYLFYQFSDQSFHFYNRQFNLNRNPQIKGNQDRQMIEDKSGLLWIGTRPHLYKQAPLKRKIIPYSNFPQKEKSLPNDSITYLLEDHQQSLWIGTNKGLALYLDQKDEFQIFQNESFNLSSLSNNQVRVMMEDSDQRLWVGTRQGLNRLKKDGSGFERFFEQAQVQFLMEDQKNRIWVSVFNAGVFVIDKKTGVTLKSFAPNINDPFSLKSPFIRTIFQDSQGRIWLGDPYSNEFGIFLLNEDEEGFTHFHQEPDRPNSLASNEIYFFTEDTQKQIWIGTDEGLYRFNDKNQFDTYLESPNFIALSSYARDQEGQLWFTTYSGGGLAFVDPESGKIKMYGEKEGLLHHDIMTIVKDKSGCFWLPTQRGISVFDPKTEHFSSYYEKDGFTFRKGNRFAKSLLRSNGEVWIGTLNGLNKIIPAKLQQKNPSPPQVCITSLAIQDSVYSAPDGKIFQKTVSYTKEIKLQYWQKDLSFTFVALHYLRSFDNLYSWKLENYDQDWSEPSKERKVSYTNLSPGTYTFRVKASNADGIWNEEGAFIKIIILPPWWRTWWAYTLYLSAAVALIIFIVRWRTHSLQKRQKVLEHTVTERTQALKESNEELVQLNEELKQRSEEIATQRDALEKALNELKNTQSQLVQSEKMASLGQLTAGIAHEINNPINYIYAGVDSLKINIEDIKGLLARYEELLPEEKRSEIETYKAEIEYTEVLLDLDSLTASIKNGASRSKEIIKGLRTFSRLDEEARKQVDIAENLDATLTLLHNQYKDRIELVKNYQPTPPISAYPGPLNQVFMNVLANAIQAIEGKGVIELGVGIQESRLGKKPFVGISIKDSGVGMSPEVQKRIFEPFFTTKEVGQGTGLGLSISHGIIEKHGGHMEVESEVGKGTVFRILLPLGR